MKYENTGSKPTCQPQHDATNPKGQSHTMPSAGTPPAVSPLAGGVNHSVDPKSTMGYRPNE